MQAAVSMEAAERDVVDLRYLQSSEVPNLQVAHPALYTYKEKIDRKFTASLRMIF